MSNRPMMNGKTSVLASGVALVALACGGSGGGGTVVRGGVNGAGGEVVRTASGAAVSATANQRFEAAVAAMNQHDNAADGRGDWADASCNQVAGMFEEAANAQPNGAFPEAWFNRALALDHCAATRDRARESLERSLRAARNNSYCRAEVQLGVYQYRANNASQALATYQRAIERDPNCVEGYTNAALVLRERNGPGSPSSTPAVPPDRVQAVNYIRQALARDDRYIPALNQLALTYLADAGDDPRSQRLMLAGIVCAQAVQVNQAHAAEMTAYVRSYIADVYNTWGLISIRTNQIIRALDQFRRAFTLNPELFEAYVNYGTINLNFRGYGDAKTAFEQAIRIRPNDYDSHIGLGVALRGLIPADQASPQREPAARAALAEYERARTLDANRPEAYYNIGVLHEGYMNGQVADLRQAVTFLEQFVQKAGGNARYTDAVTRARVHIRNNQQTIQALEAVAAAGGSGPATTPATTPAADAGAATPATGATPAAGGATPAATTPAATTPAARP